VLRRIWYQSAEDNVLFLAGGLAFNVLLALVPFALLSMSGMALLLGSQPEDAVRTVTGLLPALLPNDAPAATELLRGLVADVYRTRGTVGVYAAIGFVWFSTRLFGSLRSVLALVFSHDDRGIVVGKLFDMVATLVATVAVVVYIAMTTYLDLAAAQGAQLMVQAGLRESAMGGITYVAGRIVAVLVIFSLFYALYRGLPRQRPSVRTAFIAAASASLLFEAARYAFAMLVRQFDPSSLYTGTIAAIVGVVFWTYYGSLLFLIGGEIAQASELRRSELSALQRHDRKAAGKPARASGRRSAVRNGTPSSKSGNKS
jgi:membrane protein